MASTSINRNSRKHVLRTALIGVVLAGLLGGCSSVPDVVNPVKWYEKTTDFFSGDAQASGAVEPGAGGDNQGLAADPDAPQPAQQIAEAEGGLSADQGGEYASQPISRQAPAGELYAPTAPSAAPPPPPAVPARPVVAAPIAPPAPVVMPSRPQVAATPPMPSAPQMSTPALAPRQPSTALASGETPPMPPVLAGPANAQPAMGGDEFGTVVISADGIDAPQPAPLPVMAAAPAAQAGGQDLRFPEPGSTTSQNQPRSAMGMLHVATIFFSNNSAGLDARDRSILAAVAQLQKERGGRVIAIGHASSRTSDMDFVKHQMTNFQISVARANSVLGELKRQGLDDSQVTMQAVSDADPLYYEVMPSGEAGNRRVELYLAR